MKTASVRDLRQDFPRIHAWLQAGEEVVITLRREAIATLRPHPREKPGRRPLPDLTGRLRRVFGGLVIPDAKIRDILDRNRGNL